MLSLVCALPYLAFASPFDFCAQTEARSSACLHVYRALSYNFFACLAGGCTVSIITFKGSNSVCHVARSSLVFRLQDAIFFTQIEWSIQTLVCVHASFMPQTEPRHKRYARALHANCLDTSTSARLGYQTTSLTK